MFKITMVETGFNCISINFESFLGLVDLLVAYMVFFSVNQK